MKNKKWVGLGLEKIWGLPDWTCDNTHPFHIAGVHHDAAHEAIDIYQKWMYPCVVDDCPYQRLVRIKYKALEEYIENRVNESGYCELSQLIKEFARQEDLLFKEMCLKLAKGSIRRKIEAHLFYQIVSAYTEIKY